MLKAIITDFDGTLVDTFAANFFAYRQAFKAVGLTPLEEDAYRKFFGLRFDSFMRKAGVEEGKAKEIRKLKAEYYPLHFDKLRVNEKLLGEIRAFRKDGGKTAVASTARKANLMRALEYIGAEDDFDLILAGEDVKEGKPDPEIYLKTMASLNVSPDETLIFEDSNTGIEAAKTSGAMYICVTPDWFEYSNITVI